MVKRIVKILLKLVAAVATVYSMAVILLTIIKAIIILNEKDDVDLDEDVF